MLVDFRSDTVTRPTDAMMAAVAGATTGDAARGGDETVASLQQRAAVLTGKDDAIYVPSGIMGNLTAIRTWTRPGDAIICDARAHIYTSENNGLAGVAGVSPQLVHNTKGIADPDGVSRCAGAMGRSGPALICLENTHNQAGGTVTPLENLRSIKETATRIGIPVHLDGARVFNAAVRLGCDVEEICRHTDSVMFCVSKGLGAPIGSLLCGPADFIARARTTVKMLGGAMRQSGLMAAAALVALDEFRSRLQRDHDRARLLAEELADFAPSAVCLAAVETNIVNLDPTGLGEMAPLLGRDLKARDVLIGERSDGTYRLVTHGDIDDAALAHGVAAIGSVWRALAAGAGADVHARGN